MTFVLIVFASKTLAAPQQDFELDSEASTESDVIDTELETDVYGVIITQPEASEKPVTTSFYYPYRQSMSPRLGLLLDPELLRDSDLPLIFGIRYLLPRIRSPHWEVGFDVITNEGAHISIGKRYIWNPRRNLRPYIVLSGLLAAEADEKFATIADFNNYYVKATTGFEDVVKLPMSIRIEVELAAGLKRQFALLNFGFSWGW